MPAEPSGCLCIRRMPDCGAQCELVLFSLRPPAPHLLHLSPPSLSLPSPCLNPATLQMEGFVFQLQTRLGALTPRKRRHGSCLQHGGRLGKSSPPPSSPLLLQPPNLHELTPKVLGEGGRLTANVRWGESRRCGVLGCVMSTQMMPEPSPISAERHCLVWTQRKEPGPHAK